MLKKCLLALLLLFAVSGVSAETYYLNEGNFSNTTLVDISGVDYAYVIINSPGEYILNCSPIYDGDYHTAIFVNATENVVINGNGNEIPSCTPDNNIFSIYVKDSTNVTIENLNILTNNGTGIKYENSNHGKISNCQIHVSNYAIYLSNSNYCEVLNNRLSGYMSTFAFWNSNYDTIINNDVSISGGYGMTILNSNYNNISNSTVKTSPAAVFVSPGINLGNSNNNTFDNINSTVNSTAFVFENSNNNVIKSSVLTVTSSKAIEFSGSSTGNNVYCSDLTAGSMPVIKYSSGLVSNYLYANNIRGGLYDGDPVLSFTSPYEMNYNYLGTEYKNYLGNYWYDYNETELGATNVNGIWDVPYAVTATINDSYPLAGIVGVDIINICQSTGNETGGEGDEEPLDDGLIHLTQADFNNETGYTITKSGYYVLDENITNISYGIWINSSNVTVDGRGFSLIGDYMFYLTPPGVTPSTGIVISQIDAENESLENITIKNTALTGWCLGIGTAMEKRVKNGCSEINVSGCNFSRNTLGCMLQLTQDVNVTRCNFEFGSVGVYINGQDAAVSGCNFSCNIYGAEIYGQNNTVSNCIFTETKIEGSTGVRIGMLVNGKYITVSGCNFSGVSDYFGGETCIGINVEYLQNGIITGCNFNGIGTGISNPDYGFENSTITYNEFNNTFRGLDIIGKNNWIYLNNFENNLENMGPYSAFRNYFHSPVLTYEYNGKTYTGRLGNYYGKELGTSYAGIFDKPYGLIPMIS
ncbi:right-handed parallel beta-helix repeat-containing protein [Methanococcus sp. CF]